MRLYRCVLIFVVLWFVFSSECNNSYAIYTYEGREENAQWRKKALDRIEKIRKSQLSVDVVDGKGNPLPNAHVSIKMVRHAFGFGSSVSARDLTAQTSDGEHYKQKVERNFNIVTLENDLKWGAWETSKGYTSSIYRMTKTDDALTWLNQRQILVRGHYAVWGHLEGDEGTSSRKTLPVQDFRAAVLSHVEEKVTKIGSRVVEWDVVNHPIGWGIGTMSDLFGDNFYDSIFERVARLNPRAKRVLNEGGVLPFNGYNREQYIQLISGMLERKAQVDIIGFMGHFKADRDLSSPEELLATYDRFKVFGLPLKVTEFDVRFGNEMGKPYLLTPEQEALQADYMRDFLIASFSHPSLVGVVMWGFWEGRHWYPDAALYRKDWSIKPNGKVWENLVLQQWWTNESGTTNRKGRLTIRGFLGDYIVSVNTGGKKAVTKRLKLDSKGATIRVVVD